MLNDIAVPKVVALIGGGYRVYYTTSGGPTEIASATLSDGLTWATDEAPVITSAAGSPVDWSFVALANGTFRVYYGLFLGLTTP